MRKRYPLLIALLLGALLSACTQTPKPTSRAPGEETPDTVLEPTASTQVRFNGIWVKSNLPTRSIFNWQQAHFVAENTRLKALGYAMVDLSAFAFPDGGVRYNAIWKQGVSTDRPWVAGWASQHFWPKYNELTEAGYCLEVFNAFTVSGDFRYNAIWKRCGAKPSFTPSLEAQWLAEDVASNAAQGRQLKRLSSRVQNGTHYYTVLYTPLSAHQPWIAGWEQSHFASEEARLRAQGYGLKDLQGAVLNGNQVRYDAVWEKSSVFRPARWGHTQADFQAALDTLAQGGYVPLTISAFVTTNQGF